MTEAQQVAVVVDSIRAVENGTVIWPDPPVDWAQTLKELALSTRVKVSGIPVNKIEITGHVTF
jgi:hypothetical protein